MTIWRFVAFTIVGSAIFSSAVAGLGYALSSSWHHVVKDFSDVGYAALALAVLAVALAAAHRVKVLRAERAERAERASSTEPARSRS